MLGLAGWGYYKYQQPRLIQSQTNSISEKVQPMSVEQITNESVDAEWRLLSNEQLLAMTSKEKYLTIFPDFPIRLQEVVDLTGDGLDEGIFTGDGGNNDLSFIVMKNTDGSTSIAKQKNKNGSIEATNLLSVGRVMVSAEWKLLPSEHSFYTVGKYNDGTSDKQICSEVQAYTWNPLTKIFEWNESLSAKYTEQVCK